MKIIISYSSITQRTKATEAKYELVAEYVPTGQYKAMFNDSENPLNTTDGQEYYLEIVTTEEIAVTLNYYQVGSTASTGAEKVSITNEKVLLTKIPTNCNKINENWTPTDVTTPGTFKLWHRIA